MANLDRVRVTWSGLQGGAAVSTFYAQPMTVGTLTSLRAFFTAVAGGIPSAASLTVEGSGDTIDEVTGDLVGAWSIDAGTVIGGGGPGAYASPTGVVVEWQTGTVVNRRRVLGKTFLVPVISSTFDSNGTPIADRLATIQAAASAFATASAGAFRIWVRPFKPPLESGLPARPGTSAPIVSARVPDTAAILRSRRD